VLAQVDNVLVWNYKPKFLFADRSDPDSDWPKGSTLATIHAKVGEGFTLMLLKSQLAISLSEVTRLPGQLHGGGTAFNASFAGQLHGGGTAFDGRRRRR
jgi:hypothetical protein